LDSSVKGLGRWPATLPSGKDYLTSHARAAAISRA